MKRVALAVGLTALLGLVAANASAQHGTVMGKVVDQDGQPIIGAVVKATSPKGDMRGFDAKTNKKGEFSLVILMHAGPWQLTITAPGYGEYKSREPFRVNLGGPPMELGEIKLFKADVAGAPKYRTVDEDAKLVAENKAIQTQFNQAVLITQEADAALDAHDTATANAKYDQALAMLEALIVTYPQIAELRHNVGYIASRRKDWAKAAEAYSKAVELKPDLAEGYLYAAVAYGNMGNHAKVLEIVKEGVAKNPGNARLQIAIGEIYYNSTQYANATAALKAAQEIDPAAPEPFYFLGMIAVTQSRTQECITLLEKFLALNPSNPGQVQAAKGVLSALKPAKK
jgi:tetratricopeptide (TPR) repeat protein